MTDRRPGHAWPLLCLALATPLSPAPSAAEPVTPPARPALLHLPLPPEVVGLAGLPGPLPKGRELYLPIVAEQARQQGLPLDVADAVIRVESAYNPNAIGGVNERGLMQILPTTATLLGFTGPIEGLAEPATNIRLGVRYLAGAWRLAGGDLCRALMKYRAGHNEQRMSALSVEYCRRAKVHLASIGSPLAAGPLPAAEFGFAPAPALGQTFAAVGGGGQVRRVGGRLRRIMPVRSAATSRKFWVAHMSRVKAIEARLPWKRGGIMAGG